VSLSKSGAVLKLNEAKSSVSEAEFAVKADQYKIITSGFSEEPQMLKVVKAYP